MKKRIPVIALDRIRVISEKYVTWCSGCGEDVDLVRIDEAAEIACTNTSTIVERAAAGEIHLGIRPEALLFCVNSLLRSGSFMVRQKYQESSASLSLNQ